MKNKKYKTLDDVPHFIWNGIAGLLRRGLQTRAEDIFHSICLKIKQLPQFEAWMLARKITQVSTAKYPKIP